MAASGASAPDGDRALQFRQLVLPHLDGAYNLARYLTRDPTLSEDVVQDSVLRAYRAFDQFRGGSARAWLLAIVRNCCSTALASQRGSLALVVHESSLDENGVRQLNEHPDGAATPEEQRAPGGRSRNRSARPSKRFPSRFERPSCCAISRISLMPRSPR